MFISRRNPLFRSSEEKDIDHSVGSLTDDIRQQDLEGVTGGSSLECAALTLAIVSVYLGVTQAVPCGWVLTASAECSRTGNSCT